MKRSMVIYLALMGYLVAVKVVLDLTSVDGVVPSQAAIFSWPVIGFVTVAGAFSVWLTPRTGLPDLWDPAVPSRKRLLLPAAIGLGLGVISLAVQGPIGAIDDLAEAAGVPSINVAFPGSVLFYSGGAIVIEALFRLILITLPLWLIADVILRKRGRVQVFWALAVLTSLLEPIDQLGLIAENASGNGALNPGLMAAMGISIFLMNLTEALVFWRFGFLAPLMLRLGYYLVWHIVGGAIGF